MFTAIGNFFVGIWIGVLSIFNYFVDIIRGPITDLRTWEFLIVIILLVAALFILKAILKCLWSGVKVVARGTKKLANHSKEKAQNTQCRKCGRSLMNCICKENEHKSYSARLRAHKRETKRLNKSK